MRNQNKLLLVACVVLWGMNGCTLDYPVEVGDKCFEGDTLTDKDGTLTDKRLNKIYTKQGVITCAWNEAKKMFEAICEEDVEDCESYQYYCDKSFCPKDYQCVTDSRIQNEVYYECDNYNCQVVGLAERSCVNTETGCAFWEHYESSQVDTTRCRVLPDNKGYCCLNDDHHCGDETNACSARKGVVKSACRYNGYAPKCMDIMCDEYYTQTEEDRFKCKPMTNCKANEHLSENEQHEVICEANDTQNCGSRGYACSEKVPGWQSGRCDIEECDDPDKTECNASCVVVDCKDGYIKTEDGRCEAEFFCSSDKHIYGEQCELNDDYHCGEHDNKCNAITESCDVNHGVCICKKGYMKYKDLCIKELSDECGVDNYITTIFDQKLVRAYCIDSDEAFNTLLEEADKGNVWPEDNYDRAYALMTDIDLGTKNGWKSIGNNKQKFSGVFMGNGHTITGNLICESSCSLFGDVVDSDILNLNLNIYVRSNNSIGSYVLANVVMNSRINNVHAVGVYGKLYQGGLVNGLTNSMLWGCSFEGDISVEDVGGDIGGLAVYAYNSQIESCRVISSINGGDMSGGLIGYGEKNIIKNSNFSGDLLDGNYVGGIIGWTSQLTIVESGVYGNLKGADVGGLIGHSNQKDDVIIKSSYFSGNIDSSGVAGGFVGAVVDATLSIENSIATGKIDNSKQAYQIGSYFGYGSSSVVNILASCSIMDLFNSLGGFYVGSGTIAIPYGGYAAGVMSNVQNKFDFSAKSGWYCNNLFRYYSDMNINDSYCSKLMYFTSGTESYPYYMDGARGKKVFDQLPKDRWEERTCEITSGPANGVPTKYKLPIPKSLPALRFCE